jgi:threonine dehydratase
MLTYADAGVIAASAGNHALALAYHGGLLGIPVTVVMPVNAPLVKVNKCKKLGANVVSFGNHIGEAKDHALALAYRMLTYADVCGRMLTYADAGEAKDHALSSPEYTGQQYINGYDDPAIIAGAGTCGLEIVEQVPDVLVLVFLLA